MNVNIKGICLRKLNGTKYTVTVLILYTNQVVQTLSLNVSKYVVTFVTAICNENSFSGI